MHDMYVLQVKLRLFEANAPSGARSAPTAGRRARPWRGTWRWAQSPRVKICAIHHINAWTCVLIHPTPHPQCQVQYNWQTERTCAPTASSSHWRKSGKGSLGSAASSNPEALYSFLRSATDFIPVVASALRPWPAGDIDAAGRPMNPSRGSRARPPAAAAATAALEERARSEVKAPVASTMRIVHVPMHLARGVGGNKSELGDAQGARRGAQEQQLVGVLGCLSA